MTEDWIELEHPSERMGGALFSKIGWWLIEAQWSLWQFLTAKSSPNPLNDDPT